MPTLTFTLFQLALLVAGAIGVVLAPVQTAAVGAVVIVWRSVVGLAELNPENRKLNEALTRLEEIKALLHP